MRFFAIFLISVFCALGADELFAPCAQKNRLAYEGLGVAIDADHLLVSLGFLEPQILPKDWNVTKRDRLTGLTIVSARHNKEPIVMRAADRVLEHKNLLYMNENEAIETASASLNRQFGAKLATTDRQLKSGSLLTAPCYAVVGISALGATIESEFLRHFIEAEVETEDGAFFWGDLGVRLDGARVAAVNPFEKNSLKIGDRITALNGKTYNDSRELERAIAFLKVGSEANVSIEREIAPKEPITPIAPIAAADEANASKNDANATTQELQEPPEPIFEPFDLAVKVAARRGGFLYADTFLEGLGWLFDRDLFVRKIEKPKLPINVGDRIVAINGIFVSNAEDVRRVLSGVETRVRLLMQRESFQFFITTDIK